MITLHRITAAIIIIASCVIAVSCGSGDGEKETKEEKNPVKRQLDAWNNSIKSAKAITRQSNLIGVRDQLKYYTMQHGGKYPTKAQFVKLMRGKSNAVYTGEGLATSAGEKGVIAYLPPQTGIKECDVLLASGKTVKFTKVVLDQKLKVSNSLRTGLPAKSRR